MTTATATGLTTARVERLWPGQTFVCIGTGPSLTPEDVAYCRGRARVIAVKDAIRLAPDADVLYSGEIRWWRHYGPSLDFAGLRYGIQTAGIEQVAQPLGVQVLRDAGYVGLETDTSGLRTGKNSGYQAIGLAAHLGAAKIILLGYDMQIEGERQHFFGAHPYPRADVFREFVPLFETLVEPLKVLGITIVNASRRTALTCFPQMSIGEALA